MNTRPNQQKKFEMRRGQRTRGGMHTRDYFSGRRPSVQSRKQNDIPERERNLSEEAKSLLYGGRPRYNSSRRGNRRAFQNRQERFNRHETAAQEPQRFYSAFKTNKNDAKMIRTMINNLTEKSVERGETPQVLWYSDKATESGVGKRNEEIETVFLCEEISLLPNRKIINSLRRDRFLQLDEIDENHPTVISLKARLRAEKNGIELQKSTHNFKRRELKDERNAKETEAFKNHCMQKSRQNFLRRQKTTNPEAMEVASSESGIESTISENLIPKTKEKDSENNEEYAVDFTQEQKTIITKVKPQPAHGVLRRLPTPPGADDGTSVRSRFICFTIKIEISAEPEALKVVREYTDAAERICDEQDLDLPELICDWLDEPRDQLAKIEEIERNFGRIILLKTYFMTWVVELYGGLCTFEDSNTGVFRRRTPGGTFYAMFRNISMNEDDYTERVKFLRKHNYSFRRECQRLGKETVRSLINMSKLNMADLKRAGLSDCLQEFENISVHDIDLDKREPIEETLAKSFERVSLAKQKNEIGSEDEEENEEDDVERGLFDHVLTCYD